MQFRFFHNDAPGLLKENLASQLRKEILEGRIKPGERIVEGKWSRKLGVAQTSVREALNILVSEGFVRKGHGRSARVINLSQQDVMDIYDVRAALEGAAARLVAERRPDLGELDRIVDRMRVVVTRPDIREILECVVDFHLTLCERSANPCLLEQFRRLTVPMYAFTLLRALSERLGPEHWAINVETHERIVFALRSGDPFFAEQYVSRSILRFAQLARNVWAKENGGPSIPNQQ